MGAFHIAKTLEDKKQVFGWANVAADAAGTNIIDRQGDMISPEDLEAAAYDYVLKFGDTGERHDPNLRKKGKLIESVIFTKEKLEAMGLKEGSLPYGWWVGFQMTDDTAWEKIKKGEYSMFSIEGVATKIPVEKKVKARTYEEFFKK